MTIKKLKEKKAEINHHFLKEISINIDFHSENYPQFYKVEAPLKIIGLLNNQG